MMPGGRHRAPDGSVVDRPHRGAHSAPPASPRRADAAFRQSPAARHSHRSRRHPHAPFGDRRARPPSPFWRTTSRVSRARRVGPVSGDRSRARLAEACGPKACAPRGRCSAAERFPMLPHVGQPQWCRFIVAGVRSGPRRIQLAGRERGGKQTHHYTPAREASRAMLNGQPGRLRRDRQTTSRAVQVDHPGTAGSVSLAGNAPHRRPAQPEPALPTHDRARCATRVPCIHISLARESPTKRPRTDPAASL